MRLSLSLSLSVCLSLCVELFTKLWNSFDEIFRVASDEIQQQRREFNQPLWVAYVDLKAAFDSVDRTALWQLLPHQIVALFKALYSDTVSCVRADGSESEWFPVFSGVRQGCVVAPDAFSGSHELAT